MSDSEQPGTAENAPETDDGDRPASAFQSNPLRSVPIEVMVSIGKSLPKVSEFVQLRRDSVLTLNSRIDDPVEIYVGDRLIARGDLQELSGEDEGRLAVRLTEVADLSDGI